MFIMTKGNYLDDEHADNFLFTLSRNERKSHIQHIIIEALRLLAEEPLTKPELRDLTRIRKKTLVKWLPHLIEIEAITRTGGGCKGSPFRYALSEKWRNSQKVPG